MWYWVKKIKHYQFHTSSNVTSCGDEEDDDGRICTKSNIILASPGVRKNSVYVHWNPELVNWLLWIYRTFIKYMFRTFIYINIRTRLITDWQYDVFLLFHLPHRNLCSSEQPNNKVLKRGRDDCVVVQVNKWLSNMTTTLHNLIYEQRVCIDNPWIMNGHKHSTSLITWRFCFQLDWCH